MATLTNVQKQVGRSDANQDQNQFIHSAVVTYDKAVTKIGYNKLNILLRYSCGQGAIRAR